MADEEPPDSSEDQQLTQELTAEAEETTADLQEAKQEAAQARKAGDTDRAEQLERRIAAISGDLAEIKKQLTALVERPFHPAPEPKAPASATPEGKAAEAPEEPAAPKMRTASKGWFGARA